jgi:Ser/Thr protein kinase RdoA (MazF antagonist)
MLSHADSELVRLDPALPGLGTLLDPEAFMVRLRQQLPALDLESARMTYLKYRPASRCLVGYRLQGVQGWELDVSATAYPCRGRRRLTQTREMIMAAEGRETSLMVLEDCASIVHVFPRDRKLRALTRLADHGRRRRLIKELLPERPEFKNANVYSLAYKPERRHVSLLQTHDGTRVILKSYTRGGYATAKAMANVFDARGKLRVPRLSGCSDHYQMLAFEWMPGRTLEGALNADPPDLTGVAVAGAALAVLHDQNPWRLAPRDRRKDEATLRNVAQVIRYLCPDRGEFAAGLAHHLAERLHEAAPVPRALHGNFLARHVLLAGASVTLLDFDRAARGNPASDIGTFLANLELMVLSQRMSEATAFALRNALLEGYQVRLRRISPAWIEAYTALSLFQQALTPFRLRAPDWPAQVATLLARCANLVGWPTRATPTKIELDDSDTEFDTPRPAGL